VVRIGVTENGFGEKAPATLDDEPGVGRESPVSKAADPGVRQARREIFSGRERTEKGKASR
jgi:hypothetical protein